MNSITVKAPSSTANLGPGFDVFGLAVDAFYDRITITKKKQKGITITSNHDIPTSPSKNTAGLVVQNIAKKFKIKTGLEMHVNKGVPAGFGMGSSAASAAAAALAMDKLFRLNLNDNELVRFAGTGERAAAGTIHYDNVAASVLGGFVIVRTDPLDVIKVAPPKNLLMCVAIPKLAVPPKKTMVSRGAIPKKVLFTASIKNLSNASSIVAGFVKKDPTIIGKSINDVIVEPARKHMIPGFDTVKKNAIKAGALGVTISGAGPSVIAFAGPKSDTKKIALAMKRGFARAKVESEAITCRPSKGATITQRR